ncbi:hypothetical protein IHQ71_15890 [Rhizobium sp. TH2]|uniref:hypothetical protein n=1 Tax=Rhizobium sp. TH2 TaxID=2775403 RepID=UPI0021583561|nr:hypothetical protein [Rhizobium sp. TH2]UVC06736.1 hypothetical protein IHQ71_15890 [Rhizobium sp. TH2]
MLFDESEIEEAHSAALQIEPAKTLLGHLSVAVDLVRKSYIQSAHAPIVQTVIFSLAVRTINSAGACLKLAGSGYFAGAFHQLRELAELGELLEYFLAKPEK